MPKQGSKKLNVVPLGKQQAKQPRGEAVRVKLLDAAEALLLEQDAHQLRLNDVLAQGRNRPEPVSGNPPGPTQPG